jgi:uncharacterized lipoprotein YmbA
MKRYALVAVLMVVGCAGQPPQHTQYLLRAETPRGVADQPQATIGLGSVSVATYIDGLGLVLETASGEVRAARYHQWAEPLRESLRDFLASEISARSGLAIRARGRGEADPQRRIDVRLDQLHGTAEGDAKLVAYWSIVDTGNRSVLSEHQFSDRKALGGDGYSELVRAEEALLRDLSAAIAASL